MCPIPYAETVADDVNRAGFIGDFVEMKTVELTPPVIGLPQVDLSVIRAVASPSKPSVRREREHVVQKPRPVVYQLHQDGSAPDRFWRIDALMEASMRHEVRHTLTTVNKKSCGQVPPGGLDPYVVDV